MRPPASREELARRVLEAESPEFWRTLAPDLTITEDESEISVAPRAFDEVELRNLTRRLRREGFFRTEPILPPETARAMAGVVQRIVDLDLPGVFSIVYDEFHDVLASLDELLEPILGPGYEAVPSFWTWCVPAGDVFSGFAPHRDAEFDDAVRDDGRPTVLTAWIALTDATPDNGCIHVLPKNRDPQRSTKADPYDGTPVDPQAIRAVPVPAGSMLGWGQYLLHWSGASSEWAKEPRVSYALEFKARDAVPSIEGWSPRRRPSFARRLHWISRGLALYGGRVQRREVRAFQEKFAVAPSPRG